MSELQRCLEGCDALHCQIQAALGTLCTLGEGHPDIETGARAARDSLLGVGTQPKSPQLRVLVLFEQEEHAKYTTWYESTLGDGDEDGNE